jgi:hypothetical protein
MWKQEILCFYIKQYKSPQSTYIHRWAGENNFEKTNNQSVELPFIIPKLIGAPAIM